MADDGLEEMSTQELLDRVAVLQARDKAMTDELSVLKAEVRRRMKVGDYADFISSDGRDVRLSVQSGGVKYTYDVEAFRDVLDPELFDKITNTVINDDRLYEAISAGDIPRHLLQAPITTEKKGTPRVTITARRRAV